MKRIKMMAINAKGRSKSSIVAILALFLATGGCSPSIPTLAILEKERVSCSSLEPISWSDMDTEYTVKGVKEYNAVYTNVCSTKNFITCNSLQPILWSEDDTKETVIEVKELNAVYGNQCG